MRTEAQKEYQRRYYQSHKEDFSRRSREWSTKNKDRWLGYSRQYYQDHKEEYAHRGRESRERNKDRDQLRLKKYYQEHKEVYAARGKVWRESHREKCVENVLKSRAKNPERFKQYQKQWGDKHREETRAKQQTIEYKTMMREYCKGHYRKNKTKYFAKSAKRRALLAGAAVNLKGIEEWCGKFRSQKTFTCYWCEKRTPRKLLHFDHIIPVSRGGAHSVENMCPSCAQCNLSKGNKLVSEWKKTHGGQIEI